MAKSFSVETEENRFRFHQRTRDQIKALMLDLDVSATDVVERAVDELWQREMGPTERDVLAELDALQQRVAALEERK